MNKLAVSHRYRSLRPQDRTTPASEQASEAEHRALREKELTQVVSKANDLCVLGLLGIADKPRENISQVIAACKRAGIQVLMITGNRQSLMKSYFVNKYIIR